MKNKPVESITRIANQHKTSKAYAKYIARVSEGKLTRDENPSTHFCVYFAAYDPIQKEVFIGHHKKSNLWLFNGGHIDQGETPEEALTREIGEEWGVDISPQAIGEPKLLTITEINNPTKQTCTRHYDIWYFVPVSKSNFKPDSKKLAKEFHETRWVDPNEAIKLVTDNNTLEAISKIERDFQGKNKKHYHQS